jgi:hypothetical protein
VRREADEVASVVRAALGHGRLRPAPEPAPIAFDRRLLYVCWCCCRPAS